jgi:hypothetical protein
MTLRDQVESALKSPEPVLELRDLAAGMLRTGRTHDDVLANFEAVRSQLRNADREADEDAVMDVMDFIIGWCSPHMKL